MMILDSTTGNFSFFAIFCKIMRAPLDKQKRICYNIITMKNAIVPNQIVQEADNLSKEIGINFRDCLEILFKAHQDLGCNNCPHQEVCTEAQGVTARTH